jgi:hypothetical protein
MAREAIQIIGDKQALATPEAHALRVFLNSGRWEMVPAASSSQMRHLSPDLCLLFCAVCKGFSSLHQGPHHVGQT